MQNLVEREKNGLKKPIFPSNIAALVQLQIEKGQWIYKTEWSEEFFLFP